MAALCPVMALPRIPAPLLTSKPSRKSIVLLALVFSSTGSAPCSKLCHGFVQPGASCGLLVACRRTPHLQFLKGTEPLENPFRKSGDGVVSKVPFGVEESRGADETTLLGYRCHFRIPYVFFMRGAYQHVAFHLACRVFAIHRWYCCLEGSAHGLGALKGCAIYHDETPLGYS